MANKFSSKRLNFQPVNQTHVSDLFAALGHSSVHEFINSEDFQNKNSIEQFIERVTQGPKDSNDRWLNFVCYLQEEVIGLVQATVHGSWAEIAYLFNPSFQGKGFATESVLWLVAQLHKEFEIDELWATTTPKNIRSVALLRRAKFTEVQIWERDISSYDNGDLVFRRI